MSLPRRGNLSVLTGHPHWLATTVGMCFLKRKGLAAPLWKEYWACQWRITVGTVPKDTSELPLGSLHVEEKPWGQSQCGRTQCISYDGRTDRRTSFVFVRVTGNDGKSFSYSSWAQKSKVRCQQDWLLLWLWGKTVLSPSLWWLLAVFGLLSFLWLHQLTDASIITWLFPCMSLCPHLSYIFSYKDTGYGI